MVAKDTFSQIGGSWLFIKPTYMSSRSDDMIARPPMARLSNESEEDILVMSRLNLTISCMSTVSNDVNKPLSWMTNVVGPVRKSTSESGAPDNASLSPSTAENANVLTESSGERPPGARRRAGVASMAWRS